MIVVATAVLLAPPKEIAPSISPARSMRVNLLVAPAIMRPAALAVSLDWRISWMSPPASFATTSAVMSGVTVGSPPVLVSIRMAR
jgi:hypothetical protein